MDSHLQELNRKITETENQKGVQFNANLLSAKLLFRRASGTVIGKAEFLQDLQKPNSFTERIAENIQVTLLPEVADRALVMLIVRTQRADSTTQLFLNIRFFTRAATGWELDAWHNDEITSL
jgi:hypothetical protein